MVLDSQQFLDRIKKAAEKASFRIARNLVEYYHQDCYSGDVGPFRKPSSFEYQREFRLVVFPGSADAVKLQIGSLKGITTRIYPLAEINELIEFNSLPS